MFKRHVASRGSSATAAPFRRTFNVRALSIGFQVRDMAGVTARPSRFMSSPACTGRDKSDYGAV